ncbi:MAG: hypothetical protein Q8N87_04025 [bacterium]|nr:hypothetical protein [bacterium]
MKKLTANWTGVITLLMNDTPIAKLDCRLYSATGRPKPLSLSQVHAECLTAVSEETKEAKEQMGGEGKEKISPQVTQVRHEPYCPKCGRFLKTDEVSRAIETATGSVKITEAELAALAFTPNKAVTAKLFRGDGAVAAIGVDIRFYVLPRATSLEAYGIVLYVLGATEGVGFIEEVVIDKKPRVGVLRLLKFPKVLFGHEDKVLVFDALIDTGSLKDPRGFPDYSHTITALANKSQLDETISRLAEPLAAIDPEKCIDPRRQRIAMLARKKLEEAISRR